MVHAVADAVKAEAEKRLSPGTNQYTRSMEIFPQTEKGASRDILGSMAGVSGKTYEHAVKVIEQASPETKAALRRGDMYRHTSEAGSPVEACYCGKGRRTHEEPCAEFCIGYNKGRACPCRWRIT